ncbi:MAG: hypothetical protein COS95_04610 [Ignavibacteriales bacterium CG07_land_8_20_14_0_80_59_12]|nr:MAG: hypothetical protein COS95_04610 [Ignavibacteriales bacterium CG07_land_8_20_14_0_80_59_12]
MKRYKEATEKCKRIFIGVDLDCLQWHVTIRREEVELFSGSIPGKWDSLKLSRRRVWFPWSMAIT